MPDEATGPGRDEDLGGDTSGHSTDIGSGSSHAQGGDAPHRAFGSVTPGADNPYSAEDANAASDASSPSEGTPEDLRIGGERPGLKDEEGAPAGDDGRETAP